jgi:membrane glycosyltransferase
MMVSQTKIVLEILSGKDSGWSAQNRDGRTNWKTAFNRYIGHTILGIATTLLVYFQLNSLFYWILPITIGLMLSIPLASLSSYESIGLGLLKRKWFVIPEEIHIPQVANKAKRIYAVLKKDKKTNGVLDLIDDNYLLEIHTYMLKTNGPAPEFGKSVRNEALIKLHNYINYGKIPQFTPDEEISILYDADALHDASLLHYLYK